MKTHRFSFPFERGDRCRVIGNNTEHNLDIGSIVEINYVGNHYGATCDYTPGQGTSTQKVYIRAVDLELCSKDILPDDLFEVE